MTHRLGGWALHPKLPNAMAELIILLVQALGDMRAAEYMKGRKVLELNPEHPIVRALAKNYKEDQDGAKVSRL